MRFLRRSAVQRFFSVGLLVSLTLWLAVPAVATQATLAEELGLPGGLESAVADALAGARTPEAFVEALAATLADTPSPALARLLDTEPEALLALLYGHLFQAFGHHDGLQAVPVGATSGATGSAPTGKAVLVRSARQSSASYALLRAAVPRVLLPVALLTSAQPLGP